MISSTNFDFVDKIRHKSSFAFTCEAAVITAGTNVSIDIDFVRYIAMISLSGQLQLFSLNVIIYTII